MESQSDRLKKLRGKHDQTMRCGIVDVLCGTEYVGGKSPTERFLEMQIRQAEVREHSALMDALTGD